MGRRLENGETFEMDLGKGISRIRCADGTYETDNFSDDDPRSWYRGEMINDTFTGQGYMEYKDGKVYNGHLNNGNWDGYGIATFPLSDGSYEIYKGYWKNNLRQGKGTTTFQDADMTIRSTHDTCYNNDLIDGPLVSRFSDGTVVSGSSFYNYAPRGPMKIEYGKDYFDESLQGCVHEGLFTYENSWYVRNGEGKFTDKRGIVYAGNFVNNKKEGMFEVTYPDGRKEKKEYTDDKETFAIHMRDTSFDAGKKPEKDTERYLEAKPVDNEKYAKELQPYFDTIIGMDTVKEQLDKMYKRFRIDQMRQKALGMAQGKQGYYFIITGNPGTGKTTVARIIGKMLYDMGILENDVFVEVDRSKLVGQYIGQTAIQTQEIIDSARGGTLFIDEAYTLYHKNDDKDFGKDVIDTLLKDMEDHRGEYCVILAGYANEMNEMIRDANPGLASRFDHKLTIKDYSPEELVDILITMADAKGFFIEKDAKEVILALINKEKIDDTFDNARYARRLLDATIERQALRLSENLDTLAMEDLQVLKAEDFGKIDKDVSSLDSCLEKLNSLIGLGSVKEEVNGFVRAIRIQNESRKRGLSIADNPLSLNMVFTGNPGTGKTTVARLLGEIYYHLGLLKRPDVFTECVRADLVGRYQGDTALKVKDVIRKSLGGILFIDEAYSLVMGDGDSFGIEAVNTLVSEIENNRDKLVVILAGYTKEMNEFLDTNSGLRSRLSKVIEFPDYTLDELVQIFRRDMKKRGYTLDASEEALKDLIGKEMKKKDFGNARGIRNLCDKVISRQNERINSLDLSSLSNETILTITDSDLSI